MPAVKDRPIATADEVLQMKRIIVCLSEIADLIPDASIHEPRCRRDLKVLVDTVAKLGKLVEAA